MRGEVASPGGYPFKPGLTVEKAVSLAGGFTSRASKTKFYIVSDNSLGGKAEARRSATLTSRIRPGDVINIEQSFF
jgi:protein involved in polysaccharide export with SLBB domain